MAQHRDEPRDPTWAAGKERVVREAVAGYLGGSAQLENVTCRRDTCAVDLRYPSYREALAQHRRVLPFEHEDHPCETGFDLRTPEPADPAAPYPMSIIFHCRPTTAAVR